MHVHEPINYNILYFDFLTKVPSVWLHSAAIEANTVDFLKARYFCPAKPQTPRYGLSLSGRFARDDDEPKSKLASPDWKAHIQRQVAVSNKQDCMAEYIYPLKRAIEEIGVPFLRFQPSCLWYIYCVTKVVLDLGVVPLTLLA